MLTEEDLEHIEAYWRAADYLFLGQIYLKDNPLLREARGPALVANVHLEGTYSELSPSVTDDISGMRALLRQFSTPGGVPSHVGPTTPGSIHEGGELGYVLTHAFGTVFDNPDLQANCEGWLEARRRCT